MSINHASREFVRDLPMEVPLAFYPPPTVQVPELGIPILRQYEYKFDKERTAILRYEQERLARLELEQDRLVAEVRREQLQEEAGTEEMLVCKALKNEVASGSAASEEWLNSSSKLNGLSTHDDIGQHDGRHQMPQSQTFPLLRPVPVSQNTMAVPFTSSSTKMQRQKVSTFSFEEFEVKKDLFDLLELRSLDDRRELESLLLGQQKGQSSSTDSFPSSAAHNTNCPLLAQQIKQQKSSPSSSR